MCYNINIELKDNYLSAVVSGERTNENIFALASEILDVCLRNSITDVYIDLCQLTGRLSITESYLVVTKVFPMIKLFRQLKKVAVLEMKERYERSRFFERVAHANGYNIRMFSNQKEAATWMSESTQPA